MIPPLTVMPAREQSPLPGPPYHRWELEDGTLWSEFHRCGVDVLLRFPGIADYAVPKDARAATCWPSPGTGAATRDHVYINQVMPFLLARRGRLAFHASAVATGASAIAFVGCSGRGKSTLAASFAAAGHPFLTDDGLILAEREGGYLVEPTHPSLRLWDDSREALAVAAGGTAEAVSYTDKARLLAGGDLPFCDRPMPLARAWFLEAEDAPEPRIERLSGGAALFEWVQHAFLLDLDDPAAVEAHFTAVARFCSAVPCYRLSFPRRYDRLDAVRRAILQQAEGKE
jgi:hypothetical protein